MTNGSGSVTSSIVTLMVTVRTPTVTNQPADLSVLAGAEVGLTVGASGTPPLSFQWLRNGIALTNGGNLSGATSTTLSLSNVQTNDSGSYTAIVTNLGGSATSRLASLTVSITPISPAITSQPASQSVALGGDVVFNLSATGTMPLSYQW